MSEFEVNLKGLKGAVTKEADLIKSLQKEIERLDAVISSSALNRSGFGAVVATLKTISTQLQNEKSGVEELKNCLSDAIDLYEKTEHNLAQGNKANQKIKQSIEKLGELLDALLKEEKLGENDDSSEDCGDPVNMSTGNFFYDHVDLTVAGGIPLTFRRFYNALDTKSGALGIRFVHNYEIQLEEQEDKEHILIYMGDGQRKSFAKVTDEFYIGERAALETLTKDDNGYRLHAVKGEQYYFNKKGVLLRQEDHNKRGIDFTYDEESGFLQKAENDDGNYLIYQYDETGKIICITDMADRQVNITYEDELLTQAQLADGETITYTYTEDGRMETITNADQITELKNHYLKDNRVWRQDLPDSGTMIFEYDDTTHHTTLTERNGSKTTYVQDEKYRNTAILYEDGTSEHFEYNDRNQKIKTVDRNGNTRLMSYDRQGNCTQIIDESGKKTNYTYDGNSKLISLKINGKIRLHNTYDAKGNLIVSERADGTIIKVEYDKKGRPIWLENGDGNEQRVSYDEKGNIEKIIDALGNATAYRYDDLGRAIETTDANGNRTFYEYDIRDRLIRVKNPLGAERTYQYTATGKVTEMTDFDGHTVKAEYNSINQVKSITDKEENQIRFNYDEMWNLSEKVLPNGAMTRLNYNRDNRLESVQTSGGGTFTYTYDAVGNQTEVIDAEGNRTTFTYDSANHLIEKTEADGAKTSYTYNSDGNLIQMTDACGGTWHYTYDAMDRRTSETDPLGNTTSVCYNQLGKIERICYPNGSSKTYGYDAIGRLTEIVNPDGSTESYSYDKNGNLTSRANGLGETAYMAYDCLNRLISEKNSAGGVRTYAYDAVGHMTELVDENGNRIAYEYSPNGNLTKVTDALGNETRYSYDCVGHLIKTERMGTMGDDAQGIKQETTQETTYRWNYAGNIEEVTDPLGAVERYAYDKNGRLTQKTDREGYQTTFGYDHAGNVTDILYADGREVKLSYNALNQLEEVTDWIGQTIMQLDALGRPLTVTDPNGQTVGYEWGCMGEKTALIYPDGKRAEYDYDEAMRLTTLRTEKQIIHYQYDNTGRLAEKHLPGGIITSYTYNELGKIAAIQHEGSAETESYQYTYDTAGNKIDAVKMRSGMEKDSGTYGYIYDTLNRLTEITKDGAILRKYGYDAFGNRSRKLDYTGEMPLETVYRYNLNNQLIAELTGNTETSYSYDHRGNLTGVSRGEELIKQFTFDATNRMTESMQIANGVRKHAGYQYNGLGQRVGQDIWSMEGIPTDPEQSIRYTLDITKQYHNLLQLEETQSNKNQTFYWDGNVVSMEETGEQHFYLQDDLGSPMELIDTEGRCCVAYGYDEFGVPLYNENTRFRETEAFRAFGESKECGELIEPMQPFGYTGYQMDHADGLYFAQARSYDANTGRFTSEDKIRGFLDKPITLNPYNYCWNKPLDQVDLNGMYPTAALAGAMQGILSGTDTPTAGVSDAIGKILSGENPNNSPNAGVSDDINKILRGESVDAGQFENGEVAECDKGFWDKVWDYISKTIEMLVKGNASEDVTLLGVIAEIAAAIFGVDIILDVRDIIADVLQIINE